MVVPCLPFMLKAKSSRLCTTSLLLGDQSKEATLGVVLERSRRGLRTNGWKVVWKEVRLEQMQKEVVAVLPCQVQILTWTALIEDTQLPYVQYASI